MRLFKDGNITMPLQYFYKIENGKPHYLFKESIDRFVRNEIYTLKDEEVSNLEDFIKSVSLPFEQSFLQLAFENFELSYEIQNTGLSFVTLMIGLETLFNPGPQELSHRLSRSAAVLLGISKEESKTILDDIKKDLYKKRSDIVHLGKVNAANPGDLKKLRHYVRESIVEIYKLGANTKQELLDLLDSQGFGHREKLRGL
jgi:hypothetical protein